MEDERHAIQKAVHCRVGSSEKVAEPDNQARPVHCRVGSSEMPLSAAVAVRVVHCRVGSSENFVLR